MEQHPIPQQISSYQFRLVGDMTLKQFFQVGGGSLVAIILYSSNLPGYVKWPLILISFLFGVALAFFPLEDRPLSKWLVLFAKSIYAPTLYLWKSDYQKPHYFQEETLVQNTITYVPQNLPIAEETPPVLEQNEQQFLDTVGTLADTTPATEPSVVKNEVPFIQNTSPATTEGNHTEMDKGEINKPIQIPAQTPVSLEKTNNQENFENSPQQELLSDVGSDINPMMGQKTQHTVTAQFSEDASPPIPPTRPNIIVGQVMDSNGKIVENAILEIKDDEGRPVRALKSNKLGHFMIVTPLMNGAYDIITEKDGFVFEPVRIAVAGEIIPPVAIKAKGTMNA